MLTVTHSAGQCLTKMLADAPGKSVVRMVLNGPRVKVRRDQLRTTDTRFSHNGRIVLAFDKDVAERLSHRTLGTRRTSEGVRLCLKKSTEQT